MKTFIEKLEEQLQRDAASKAYKQLASLRASAEYLRLASNATVRFAGCEMTYNKAFDQFHGELKRLLTERNIKNKVDSIVRDLAKVKS